MRDELLNNEIFLHIDEMRYVVNHWRMDYNHYRLHHYIIDIELNEKY